MTVDRSLECAFAAEETIGRVYRAAAIGASGDRIVLKAWSLDDRPRIENLVRIDAYGAELWRAALPEGCDSDCFNRFRLEEDGTIRVWTWQGMTFRIDAETGKPLICALAAGAR